MKTIKGPGLFLAQFAQDTPPHNSLDSIARWAKDYGYAGIQIPSWDSRLFDLDRAFESETYCDEVRGRLADIGIAITELSTHFQGQMVSVHPAYDAMFDGQAPEHVRGDPEKRRLWAADQVVKAAKVSQRLGLTEHVTFSGSLAWPYVYPYPQRPAGLIEECFAEQARRWRPILDAYDAAGVDLCYEIHPSEDLFDGDSFEMFLEAVGNHPRCNINYDASHYIKQGMDYLGFIDVYHDRIKMFHVKDAEFNPTARQGVFGGYKGWLERAARDRSLGWGQADFKGIFSRLAAYDFAGWAVYEWECCLEHPEVAARNGAKFIADHIIAVTDRVFDDFAATHADPATNRALLGIGGPRLMVHATGDRAGGRRLRYGMVGGGRDAFIGAVHRFAARLDDGCEIVAGAFSSNPETARLSGADLGLAPDRVYASFAEMAAREAARPDGIEAVVIVTPNHLHHPVAKAFLEAGIDVICDKPLSVTVAEADELVALQKSTGLVFVVTLNNTGYAMVRQAREMIAGGDLGTLRLVHATYLQDWLTLPIDQDGHKQAEWRTDPARAGASACLADIGVHAHNLAGYVSGLDVEAVAADLATFVPGRRLDDNAHVLLRYRGGARGVLLASQVAPGNLNTLSVKVYGDKAGIEWFGETPELLRFTPYGEPSRTLVRGGPGTSPAAARVSRMPAGHPEGYIEGFANLYRDVAVLIRARRAGEPADPAIAAAVPSIHDGARGMRFIEAAVASSRADGAWTPL